MRGHLRLRTMLLLCMGCLCSLLVVTVAAMHLLFPRFYRLRMENNLERAYETISWSGFTPDGGVDLGVIARLERENLSLLIFQPETGEVDYNSRIGAKYLDQMVAWQSEHLRAQLSGAERGYVVEVIEPNEVTTAGVPVEYGGTLYLGGRTGDRMVVITTPLESLEQTAQIGIGFMAAVCICLMFATLVIVGIASRSVTKPLAEMTGVARQIADLDFSQRCAESGSVEQRAMARSINSLSDRLQGYIHQLQAEIAEKSRSETARKELVANLSHDLKTPIGLVAGYAEGLAAGMARTPEQVQEYCTIILDETARMNSMILRMLEVSRLESGTIVLHPEPLELGELLEAILSHFTLVAQREQIEVRQSWRRPLTVRADEFALEQVLTNLIQNAMTHLSGARQVSVRAYAIGGAVRVEVQNSAEPIPEAELVQLWDSFYRRERSRARRGSESGLGLAVVRGNLELMGVPYGVQNVHGGILFWLELPAAESI